MMRSPTGLTYDVRDDRHGLFSEAVVVASYGRPASDAQTSTQHV